MTGTQDRTESLEEFDARIGTDNMIGQWSFEPMLEAAIGGPRPKGVGVVWPWEVSRKRLEEASAVLGSSGVGRCNLTFLNPGITQGQPGSTQTISAGMQIMRAHEVCWSHRHSMSALRFVIEGHPDAYTAVDGEALTMGRFDLLLTPRMSWHDHHNPSDQEIVWLDVLDMGLVGAVNTAFYETFGEASQPLRKDEAGSQALRAKALRPTWEQPRQSRLPVRYPWAVVEDVLAGYGDVAGSPYDGLALSYANPITGGPTMSTMDCWVQQLVTGFSGLRHRRTSSTVGFVLSGHASIEVGDEVLEVGPGDTYAIPNYAWQRLSNDSGEPARIFSVHDIPAIQALGLFYEEPARTQHVANAPVVPGVPHKQIYLSRIMLDADETR